jgi:hypothetical protein
MFLLEYLIFSQQHLTEENYLTINGQLYCKSTILLPSCHPLILGHGQKNHLKSSYGKKHINFLFPIVMWFISHVMCTVNNFLITLSNMYNVKKCPKLMSLCPSQQEHSPSNNIAYLVITIEKRDTKLPLICKTLACMFQKYTY